MDEADKKVILKKAQGFFKTHIADNHANNTKKCSTLSEFKFNPFLVNYIATFAFGDETPESLAKALLYPRLLGTSISTSFGTHVQTFCHEVLGGFASTTDGMDIEFFDAVDGRKKYCQLKAGPETINRDDVVTIKNHFIKLRNLARTNHLSNFNAAEDCCVGILYGNESQISSHYKKIAKEYPVLTGCNFWMHLTGDDGFYSDIIHTFADCASDYKESDLLKNTVEELAADIVRHPEMIRCENSSIV